ncbi:MAG: sirohydrochlorin cobaltochelatase [Clostridia bacterium]|nr:sirohydrochlorin cobaltochelatase [Clostridia bacterium]
MDKALLVVSFGTSYPETRERTIGAIEQKLAERFPDRVVRRAWTSNFIIKKVAKNEGLIVDTPEEALGKLAAEGIKDVIVQPTHLSDGYENQRLMEIVRDSAGQFERIAVGRPLLFTEVDRETVARLMPQLCLGDADSKALMLMGHGSDKHPVPVYGQLQDAFAKASDCVFVGTVEGTPTFEEARAKLAASGYRDVVLAPLMIVAGDHAINDLAGGSPDSWKNRLEADGYQTEVILKGLGEHEEIRELFAKHAADAENI